MSVPFQFCCLVSVSVLFASSQGCAAQGTMKDRFSIHPQTKSQETFVSTATPQQQEHPGLRDPSQANEKAPDQFKVRFETTKGNFVLEINRNASPNGVDRFYNLAKIGYFKDIAIFRAVKGFMFQFGIHGNPAISAKWSEANIKDDPGAKMSNTPGTICFAQTGAPNSRSTQMFINLANNSFLDSQGFTPFGKVVEGLEVVAKINTEYGENKGDVQGNFKQQGNNYILKQFPNLDLIKSVTILK